MNVWKHKHVTAILLLASKPTGTMRSSSPLRANLDDDDDDNDAKSTDSGSHVTPDQSCFSLASTLTLGISTSRAYHSVEEEAPVVTGNFVVATALKNTHGNGIGIRLSRVKTSDCITVVNVGDDSIFRGTALAAGMSLLRVNGVSTKGKTVREVSAMIADAEKYVSIEATYPFDQSTLSPEKVLLEKRVKELEALVAIKSTEVEAATRRANEAENTVITNSIKAQKNVVIWECKVDGSWIPYKPHVCVVLEKSVVQKTVASFQVHNKDYEVDCSVSRMKQTNKVTGFKREVRRREVEHNENYRSAVWQCYVDDSWKTYDPCIADIIEANYQWKTKAIFDQFSSRYEIDFQTETPMQVNAKTGYQRKVRRQEAESETSTRFSIPETRGVPIPWTRNVGGVNCAFVLISNSAVEWQSVQDLLSRSLPRAKIHKLKRVQNTSLWEYFCFRKERARALSGKDPHVLRVWHGTRQNDPEVICKDAKDGFMMQRSKVGMWGTGVYFAANASYSDEYSHRSDRRGNKKADGVVKSIVLAKLVVGEEVELSPDNSLRHCPEKPGGGRYDTVVGTTNGSKVYVVYENGRAYPEYIVSYTV